MTRRGIRTIIKKNAQLFLLMNEQLFSMFSFAETLQIINVYEMYSQKK